MPDVSVVIGCSSGIGLAICAALKERGDVVIGTTRSGALPPLLSISKDIEVERCDSTNLESIRDLFNRLAPRRPRHLIYCAGFHRLSPITAVSNGSLSDHFAVNFQGAVDCARIFASNKISNCDDQRTITVVSSIAHRVAEAGLIGYSASKAAIVAAVRGFAVEYAPKNIRANSVSPGWIKGARADAVEAKLPSAAMVEIRRRYPLGFGCPEDVAGAVVFLSSDSAMWITGVDLPVDGGRSCT
jgi:NAD(P)-dependent dehydrogenase (short-subunit alcohol dehydrogenase family)